VKEAAKSHTLNGAYLDRLYRNALSQGKEPRLIIVFGEHKLRLDIQIRREK
jgi:hypothetical protein